MQGNSQLQGETRLQWTLKRDHYRNLVVVIYQKLLKELVFTHSPQFTTHNYRAASVFLSRPANDSALSREIAGEIFTKNFLS
jgi:hypothetical protein